jgi:hypothetical protein
MIYIYIFIYIYILICTLITVNIALYYYPTLSVFLKLAENVKLITKAKKTPKINSDLIFEFLTMHVYYITEDDQILRVCLKPYTVSSKLVEICSLPLSCSFI